MKTCYCHTCKRHFHYLGINRHRAMHRDRRELCTITYTTGNTLTFDWRPERPGQAGASAKTVSR